MKIFKKLSKMGDSTGLIFPKILREHMGVTHGDEVSIEDIDGGIIVKKVQRMPLPESIEQLVDEHDDTNISPL